MVSTIVNHHHWILLDGSTKQNFRSSFSTPTHRPLVLLQVGNDGTLQQQPCIILHQRLKIRKGQKTKEAQKKTFSRIRGIATFAIVNNNAKYHQTSPDKTPKEENVVGKMELDKIYFVIGNPCACLPGANPVIEYRLAVKRTPRRWSDTSQSLACFHDDFSSISTTQDKTWWIITAGNAIGLDWIRQWALSWSSLITTTTTKIKLLSITIDVDRQFRICGCNAYHSFRWKDFSSVRIFIFGSWV